MEHKSVEQLNDMLHLAALQLPVGSHHYHYKDVSVQYEVMGFSILEASDEVGVRYAFVDNPSIEFVRPLSVWQEKVTYNGQTTNRFTRIS